MTASLDRELSIPHFFKKSDDKQAEYEEKVLARIAALEEQWEDSYKPALHDVLVMELVRSEMMALKYEIMLANNNETDLTPTLLSKERGHANLMREKLMISLSTVRREEPPPEGSTAPSMFDLMAQAEEEDGT